MNKLIRTSDIYPEWHFQPLRLLKKEIADPMNVINEFFSCYNLPEARKHCKEMLEDAMCNVEVYAINYITFYDNVEKLIEAAWLLKEARQTERIVSGEKNTLQSILDMLVSTIHPERIFLLSYEERVSIDLLLIISANSNKSFSHYGTLIEAACYSISTVSFSLHTSSSFAEHIEQARPFWLSCCTEKKQIYTSVETPFPLPSPEKREALAERMRTNFLFGMERGCSLLESAQANRLQGNSSISLFLLHQSAELIFRALILSLTGSEVREHSLAILRKHLRRCAPEIYRFFPDDTEEERALLSLLDAAYRKGRYDNTFSPDKEKLDILFRRIDELPDIADDCFTAILDSLNPGSG